MFWRLIAGTLILQLVMGCAGESQKIQMTDITVSPLEAKEEMKTVEFPKGTVFGGASKGQALSLAQLFVDSHNMAMQQFGRITKTQNSLQETQKSIQESDDTLKKSIQGIEESNQKSLDLAQKHLEKAQETLQALEQLSQKHGTGEITLFFPIGETKLKEKSFEYERLIHFVDFIARESRGRKVLLISIGSASAIGKKAWNLKLAQARAEFPVEIADKYLINIPHDYFKVYGTGDMYTPKEVPRKEQERFQHTRLIALFQTDQAPALPEELPQQ